MDDLSSSLFLLASFTTENHLPREWQSIGTVAWNIVVILFFVFLNGFFVASEFAIVKVRSSQLDTEIGEGTKGARFAKKVTHQLDAYLSATQLGITLASLALGFLGEPYVARILAPFLFWMNPEIPEAWGRENLPRGCFRP